MHKKSKKTKPCARMKTAPSRCARVCVLLRVRNTGDNYVSFTHVDNIAHGLLCGAHALKPGAKACGKFYVVTDGSAHRLWSVIDSAVEKVGMPSLESKLHLPTTLLYDPRTD